MIAKSGAEMFRLWVGSVEFRNDMPYSQALLDGLADWYRKLRNTARFLLGNLNDFDPTSRHGGRQRPPIDRGHDRASSGTSSHRCRAAYERYELHIVHRALVEFVTIDLSARYSDIAKDRLYSIAIDSP